MEQEEETFKPIKGMEYINTINGIIFFSKRKIDSASLKKTDISIPWLQPNGK
jgi:hypothetical protein